MDFYQPVLWGLSVFQLLTIGTEEYSLQTQNDVFMGREAAIAAHTALKASRQASYLPQTLPVGLADS